MNEEFIKAFDKMSINGKRNELNNELKVLNDVVLFMKVKAQLDEGQINEVEHYNNTKDSKMTEGEFLTQTYKNIYLIEQNVFDVAQKIFKEEEE